MMIRSIIVDDEIHSSGDLNNLLRRYCPNVEVVSVAQTVQDATSAILANEPDLIFLDVELPDGNGFNVLEKFPQHSFSLIFVTAFNHYAVQAIKVCALDYVLKPVDGNDLISAVYKATTEKEKRQSESRSSNLLYNYQQKNSFKQKIAIPTMEGLIFMLKEEIIYLAASSNYTVLYTSNNEKLIASRPLSYFAEILNADYFFRIHHSYLVNIMHVKRYLKGKGGHVVMSNGTEVPVAVRVKNDFLERFEK